MQSWPSSVVGQSAHLASRQTHELRNGQTADSSNLGSPQFGKSVNTDSFMKSVNVDFL